MIGNLHHVPLPDHRRAGHPGSAKPPDGKRDYFIVVRGNPVKRLPARVPAENLNPGELFRQLKPLKIVAENNRPELRKPFRLFQQPAQVHIPVLNPVTAQPLRNNRHDAIPHGVFLAMIVHQKHNRPGHRLHSGFLFCPAGIGARRKTRFRRRTPNPFAHLGRKQRRIPQSQRDRCRRDIQLSGKVIQISRFPAKSHLPSPDVSVSLNYNTNPFFCQRVLKFI